MTTKPGNQPGFENTNRLDIGVFGARTIPSTYGGFETFLTTLLPALVERGHLVTMYCRRGEEGAADSPYRGVKRLVLPSLTGKAFSTLSHGALASLVARRQGHNILLLVNPANSIYCWVNRLTGQPVVLNVDGQEWLRGKWGWAGRRLFRASAWLAGRSASALVADCRAMAAVFEQEFGSPSTVIPYCSPPLAWDPDRGVLEELHLANTPYFITGGRLNPENNVDGIARAFASTDLPIQLLVLGKANYDSPVQRVLTELASHDARIRLLGHVADRQAFLTLLNGATAYLHGHSVGGMNPSLVEAMHAGAVVVALDTAFNREVLSDAGLYFPGGIGVVGELAPQLRKVLALDDSDAGALRARARQRAAGEFGMDDVVGAYEALLLSASLAGRARGLTISTRWAPDS